MLLLHSSHTYQTHSRTQHSSGTHEVISLASSWLLGFFAYIELLSLYFISLTGTPTTPSTPAVAMHKSIGSGVPRTIQNAAHAPYDPSNPSDLDSHANVNANPSRATENTPLLEDSIYDEDLSSLASYDNETRGEPSRGRQDGKSRRLRERSRHAARKAKAVLDNYIEWMAEHEHYVEQPQVIWEYELFKWTMQKARVTPLIKGSWGRTGVERGKIQRSV